MARRQKRLSLTQSISFDTSMLECRHDLAAFKWPQVWLEARRLLCRLGMDRSCHSQQQAANILAKGNETGFLVLNSHNGEVCMPGETLSKKHLLVCRPGVTMKSPVSGSLAAALLGKGRRQKRFPRVPSKCLISLSWCGGTFWPP